MQNTNEMNKIKSIAKISLPHVGVLIFFFLIVLVYFYPVFEGKVLQQGDVTQFKGAAQEVLEYGKPSGWTGSVFSGMPSYHITGYNTSTNFLGWVNACVIRAVHSESAGPIFFLLLTAYFLFLVMRIPWWLAALGAVATAFSSYNIIILAAGHVTKAWTLAFVPLVLAGMYMLFNKRYWSGFVIFTFGLALLIISNHLQITYYAAIFCFILFVGFVVRCITTKEYKQLGTTSGLLAAGVLLAVLANASDLYLNYESGQESLRGKSELTPIGDGNEITASDGLDKDYVFAWSYGVGETFSLMVPNVMGGASGAYLGKDSHLYQALRSQGAQVGKEVQTNTYWGDKPFTSGPVYFGAIVCFLFLLSFFIVPGNAKWWLLGGTVVFIFLAWGRNFAVFNDFMYYHFPFYSKFRTVETALVIPAFTFPILAVMAIRELIAGQLSKEKLLRSLYISGGITAGICLLLWLMPGLFFGFDSSYDAQYNFPDWYYNALLEDRKDMLRSDALRSFVFILLAAGLLIVYVRAKNRKQLLPFVAAGLVLLILVDLWQVDSRYLNSDDYVSAKTYNEQLFPKSTADQVILQDPAPSYRVLNLRGTFQEARTSYYHKSIGGYHAAKLGRYQDLIDRRLTAEIGSIINAFNSATTFYDVTSRFNACPSLNMLNAKYIIFDESQPPLVNDYAFGNAWFVDSYRFVDTPDEEMAALDCLDPLREAVLDSKFKDNLNGLSIVPDENASIVMTAYYPNRLEYTSNSSQTGLAVFSEIYYENGWKAYIDGERVPISRADWILRTITVPAGKHEIVFEFDPDDIRTAGMVTTLFTALLLLLVIGSLVYYIRNFGRRFTPRD